MPDLIARAEEKTRKAASLRAEANALADKGELTQEEATRIDSLIEDANNLDTEATADRERHARIEANRDALDRYAKPRERVTQPEETARVEVGPPNVTKDPRGGFASLGHFAHGVGQLQSPGGAPGQAIKTWAAAGDGLNQTIAHEGGVLVPPAFSTQIWDGVRQQSMSLLDMVDLMTIDPGNESMTFPAIDETSRANGSRWGGLQGYWKAELTQMSESKPKLREVEFKPHELYVFAYIADKLLRNAPIALESWLRDKAIDEINFKIGDAIINGTGVGMPTGIIGNAATVSQAKETGQAAATIVTDNLRKMYNRLQAGLRTGAVWLVNQDAESEMQTLEFPVGTGGLPVFLPAGGLSESPLSRLYGLPIIPVEYCAALGTVGDVILTNLRFYGAAVKGAVDGQASMHLKFDYAQTAFRFIWEMDGQPWTQSTFTPYKGSTTRAPFVTLDTRS